MRSWIFVMSVAVCGAVCLINSRIITSQEVELITGAVGASGPIQYERDFLARARMHHKENTSSTPVHK